MKDRVSDYPLTGLLYNIDGKTQTLQITYLDQTLSTIKIGITKPKIRSLVTQLQTPTALSNVTIMEHTKNVLLLQLLKKTTETGNFTNNKQLKIFYPVRHALSTFNDLILLDNKILIPTTLQKHVTRLKYEAHQVFIRTKQSVWSKVWWPGMNNMIESFIQKCHPWQVVSPSTKSIPINTTPLPRSSWIMLDCDLCGPFPTGEHLLVCVDYYSRFPNVETVHNVTASSIISNLCKLLCCYGVQEILVTHNGPQSISTEKKALLKEFNIKHRRVTPYHPAANDVVEQFKEMHSNFISRGQRLAQRIRQKYTSTRKRTSTCSTYV